MEIADKHWWLNCRPDPDPSMAAKIPPQFLPPETAGKPVTSSVCQIDALKKRFGLIQIRTKILRLIRGHMGLCNEAW